MANHRILTVSQIRYLLTLKRLDQGCGVRNIAIAMEWHLSKPRVHDMMDYFLEQVILYFENSLFGNAISGCLLGKNKNIFIVK